MDYIERILNIDIPKKQSAFLWGPRKTGKSLFLKKTFPQSIIYDFLKTDLFIKYSKTPSLFREQLLAMLDEIFSPVILDEVQKIPQILDEIHWLIENTDLNFILCGSSARKLKRGRANMLGGRAWRYEMYPLIRHEIKNFDLLQALNHGLIPSHYLSKNYKKAQKSYIQDYLKEEILNEGLTRKLPAFSRFFDAMGYMHGELTNYSNIARACGVDSKTVKEYYQILIDTLLGRMIEPFKKRQETQVINKASKFYLFDVGIAGAITKRKIVEEKGELFGKALEHFILNELLAYSSYSETDFNINFWRTKTGLEVDFVLGNGEIAVEVKGTSMLDKRDFRPIITFSETYAPRKAYIVCNESQKRIYNNIEVLPWKIFLDQLWEDSIIR
jgi:predicted AAA+ superfamily ATPase